MHDLLFQSGPMECRPSFPEVIMTIIQILHNIKPNTLVVNRIVLPFLSKEFDKCCLDNC